MGILVNLLSILGAIIIIGIIILVHELGHYGVGRLCKIKIVEFAVGFGPKIKSWVKNDIIYSIRWIFLGGFTKFYGEDDELDDKDAFNRQPAGRRALTIAAGPVFNIIFAYLLAVIILTTFGEYDVVVTEVWDEGAAIEAGLEVGDVITKMNGQQIEFSMQLGAAYRNANEDYIPLTVMRDGREIDLTIDYVYIEPEVINEHISSEEDRVTEPQKMAGYSYYYQNKKYGFFEAIGKTFKWIYILFKETIIGIVLFFGSLLGAADPVYAENAGGIITITDMIAQALKSSIENVLRVGVAISASLAVFNLIPFPALDGGRLVFIGIEKATGKPVPRNVEGIIHFIGFVLLIGFMGLLIFKDVARLFGG